MLVSLGAGQTDSPTGSLVTEKVIKPETGEKQ
jgi:hypothetical protein